MNFPFCQQQAVWYKLTNQVYTNDWFVLYPRGLCAKYVEIMSGCVSVVTYAQLLCKLNSFCFSKWKNKIVNDINTLILVNMWRYVKFCTFFKILLHCGITGLSVEWWCLYCSLSTYNCYLDISHECISTVIVCPSAISKPQKFLVIRYKNTAVYCHCMLRMVM